MKKFEVYYHEEPQVNEIIVEAQNEEEAYDKAFDILRESISNLFSIRDIEEVKQKDKNE